MSNELEVHIDLAGQTHRVGTLRVMIRGGRNSASFEYDSHWKSLPTRFSLEPALIVGDGTFTPGSDRPMFASIGDSAPDTWGRRLMQRMERRSAKAEGRAVRTLTEADYLLGVADIARLGALRFRRPGQAPFQTPIDDGAVPPIVRLGTLLTTTEKVLRDEDTDEELRVLFAPGSSLGGARPKASVYDETGHLTIAKFPKEGDDYSVSAWEEIALRIADRAGIRTAAHRIVTVMGKDVLVSRRFDRLASGIRIPFLSAMALLDRKDGDIGSYPEIVDELKRHAAAAEADTHEIFRRMVANILMSNVDDHLRNHGFLWTGAAGWRLSPAYDLNPVPRDIKPLILSTNVGLDDATGSVDLARQQADYFDLDLPRADAIIAEVAEATCRWREIARAVGVKPSEIDRMESAFEHDALREALAIARSRST